MYSKGCGPRPTAVQLERDLPGITGLLYYPQEFQLHQFWLFGPNPECRWSRFIVLRLETQREPVPAHLLFLVSGNIVLAWDFNQNAGRILLMLPNGVNVQLDGGN